MQKLTQQTHELLQILIAKEASYTLPDSEERKELNEALQELTNKEKQKLIIPLSENDRHDLLSGETFDWTFDTDKGESIDIHLRPETDEDIEL